MDQSNLPLPRYDKLRQPHLHDALRRPRLFARLDDMRRSHAVTWITSPPGAGKSTLVTSYLADFAPQPVWYQIDGGDADPASLFLHLAQVVKEAPPLPRLAPEIAHEANRFARHFFREFFTRLPPGCTLVFENIQEFNWTHQAELMEIALSEIPDYLHVIAISRDAPPARLTRLLLSGVIGVLGWPEIRFDAGEARDLARIDESLSAHSALWLEKLDGWAAGLIMLRPQLAPQPDNSTAESNPASELDAVFAYFANAIFEKMPQQAQRQLMMMSFLSELSSSDAVSLTGDAAAGQLLEQLYRNRMFVDRRGVDESTYHFHALFRDFLRHEARVRLVAEDREEALKRAASLLLLQRRIAAAAELYRDAGSWPSLVSLLLRNAKDMLAAGMAISWREWHGWLPPDIASGEPWLSFWLGYSLHFSNPAEGRTALLNAEQTFRENRNLPARLLAISAILDVYAYSWSDLEEVPYWVTAMIYTLRIVDPRSLDPKATLRTHSNLVLALLLTNVTSPRVQLSIDHALEALPLVDSAAARLAAASRLLFYPEWLPADIAHGLVADMDGVVEDESISPSPRAWWCLVSAQWHLEQGGELAAAQRQIDRGLRLVSRYGMKQLHLRLQAVQVLVLLAAGESDAASNVMDGVRDMLTPELRLDHARFLTAKAQLLLQTGKAVEGLAVARHAVVRISEAHQPGSELPRFERFMAGACAQAGAFDEAGPWYDRAIMHDAGCSVESTILEKEFCALYAEHLHAAENGSAERVVERLRHAMARHRQLRDHAFFVRFPLLATSLVVLALQHQIEVSHVQAIVRRQRLQPSDRSAANWPWPIAIQSFGRLCITQFGDVQSPSGKAQQRPLQLMKALLIAGLPGRQQSQLGAQLWPDAEDPKAAVNVTLHRLRKMLDSVSAVRLDGGFVSLDSRQVWTDVEALNSLCHTIDSELTRASDQRLQHLAKDLLDLYAGPFLDGDDASWLLSAREQLRMKFLDAATQLGGRLEALCSWSRANDLYLRALTAEPLAEALYRGLMRCASAAGDAAAAYSAYRQCREALFTGIGRKPAAETERLAEKLRLSA